MSEYLKPENHFQIFTSSNFQILNLPVIFHKIPWRFVKFEAVEFGAGSRRSDLFDLRGQNIPEFDDQVFGAGEFAFHKSYVQVQVFVIYFLDDVFADQGAELFQVYYETGVRIGFAFYGYDQVVIVPVPVGVGAGTENFLVLGLRPVRVI